MKYIKSTYPLLLLVALQFFMGCKKSTEDFFNSEYQNMMLENALVQAAFDDVLKVSENILMNNQDARMATTGAPLGCDTDIDTIVTGVNQKKYTVTFQQSCTSYDGKVRSGQLLLNLNGANFNTVGAVLTITFNNYSIESNSLSGKMVVTKVNDSVFAIQVSDAGGGGYASLTIASMGKATHWQSVHQREILADGNGDAVLLNNKYFITTPGGGFFSGITSDEKSYSASVSVPLALNYDCFAVGLLRYPLSGSIAFNFEGDNYRTVNYGDVAACDKIAKMIYEDKSTDYNLY